MRRMTVPLSGPDVEFIRIPHRTSLGDPSMFDAYDFGTGTPETAIISGDPEFVGPPDNSGPYGVDSSLSEAGKWVQWAEYAEGLVSQGDDENSENVKNTRYNLSQWWAEKAALYPSASEARQRDLNILDMWAHRWWAQLEQKLAVFSAGNQALVEAYSQKAAAVFSKASALSMIIDNPRMTRSAENKVADARNLPAYVATFPEDNFLKALKDQFKTPSGGFGLFGIPWWAYAAGAAVLLLLLMPRAPQISVGGKR